MEQWKLEKLRAINDEIQVFHELLKAILSNDKTVTRYEYTHGPHEMGADFVLARQDQTIGDENYVGLVVKCGDIKQDFSAVKRQIDECAVVRYFDNGKRKIYLQEIWVVCNGSISNGAERKIYEEFKNRNIKFIDLEKLSRLVENHYPHFWNEIPTSLGLYLKGTLLETSKVESYNSLVPQSMTIDVAQDLYEIEKSQSEKKQSRFNKSLKMNLGKAISKNKLLLVEGGMGSGKTTLFRKHVKQLCEPTFFQKTKVIPCLIHYSEISDSIDEKISEKIETLTKLMESIEGEGILLFIDGIDEVKSASEESFANVVQKISVFLSSRPNVTIVLGSRPIWTFEEGEEILKYANRFRILPLSYEQIYQVIQQNCSSLGISEKLRQDLAKSSLMKALPRTPMSAILLTRVITANSKEIPQTLPELYSKYLELALGRWDIGKGLLTEREYPVIVKVLSQVAKFMLDNELHEMAVDEVLQMLKAYTKSREGLPDATSIFQKISTRSEVIFINKQKNTFSFTHKSIAEYLLALDQKETYGKSAPFTNPFEGYWLGVEYFYLGLIQDAGSRIDLLSGVQVSSERGKILRLMNFGNLMLAAYQTEYSHIEKSVYRVVIETTKYFLDIKNGVIESSLSTMPELQFFATLSFALRDSFDYPYFKKALDSAQIQCQYDNSLSEEEKNITSFFIDAIRASLKETDVFRFLTTKELGELPWVVKLGIHHVVQDEKVSLDHVDKLARKIRKARQGNAGLNKYINALYSGPMNVALLK